MDIDHFKKLVAQLETESAASPAVYHAKVAALTILGFAILALLLGAVGLGLLLLVGFVVAVVLTGGTALLLLLKLGKLLFFLAIPLWYLVKSAIQALFIRLPVPQGREIFRADAPAMFAALDDMRRQMKGPAFHHVLIVDDVNAAIVQRPMFGVVGLPRNYLLLGLPLLESMSAAEALAVVAHEYGHLAGSHGYFSAFIYRLRHTWGTVQAYTEHVQSWLGRLVAPLVRWYAPYFNAYTFVLARANEFQADAAAAELVGAANAAHALKRVNLVAPRHQRFMQQTFDRIDLDPAPPRDLMQRWAADAGQAVAGADEQRWLGDALDRERDVTDTHPTLRARLTALSYEGEALEEPPPPISGDSAAQAWFGPLVETLRAEFEAKWAEQVSKPWSERHAEAQKQRQRLIELRGLADRNTDLQLEMLQLTMRLEHETDLREPLAAFNVAHPDNALGVYLEGSFRLAKGDREGLILLDRAIELDAATTKPACEQAHAFLSERKEAKAAQGYAERWRRRDDFEIEVARQLQTMDPKHAFVSHGLGADTLSGLKSQLSGDALEFISAVYLARRVIPADPSIVQLVMGVQMSWWGRRRGKQSAVIDRLVALSWTVPLVFVTLDGQFLPMKKKLTALADAKLI